MWAQGRFNIKRGEMKKKPSRKTLVKKADDLWRNIIKVNGKCEWCGSSGGVLHAHHIMGRSRQSLRWDLRNGVCLCYSCHTPYGAHSPNAAKVEQYLIWIKSYRPEDWKYLKDKLKQPVETITTVKLMDIIENLKGLDTKRQSNIN